MNGGNESVKLGQEAAGQRLDRALAERTSAGSRQRARDALATGKVRLNGAAVGPPDGARPVLAGDVLTIAWNQPGSSLQRHRGQEAMEAAGVKVLYDDRWLLALDKPAGLLTDAASETQRREEDTLRKRAAAVSAGEIFCVHRIDRDTTGVVLFARDRAGARHLDQQFERRTPERVYLAVVVGQPRGEQGRFQDWMAWDGAQRIQRLVRPEATGAVLAEADWRVVERLNEACLIEVRLVSGRRNQIRLHALRWGHPLVGERLYVDPNDRRSPPFPRQALHAHRLGVIHPHSGETVSFTSPMPEDLENLLRRLRAPPPAKR